MIQPLVHKRDIGIEPNGCGGESGLIERPLGTYLRDDAARHFRKIGIVGAVILLPVRFYWAIWKASMLEVYITPDDQQLNRRAAFVVVFLLTIPHVAEARASGSETATRHAPICEKHTSPNDARDYIEQPRSQKQFDAAPVVTSNPSWSER
jgi:type II secretory pathway component PulM